MSQMSICKDCNHQCCEHVSPMVTPHELHNIEQKLNIKIPTYIDDSLVHLGNVPGYTDHIRIKPTCPMYREHVGCILEYNDRPTICRLIPWIPHMFRTNDWDLLLDVSRCKELSPDWCKTYDDAKKEFDKILEGDPDWH